MARSLPKSYRTLLADITGVYERARGASARAVSAILVGAYWEIGRRIIEEEQRGAARADYRSRLLKRLSRDLTRQCGQGFSETNLRYMRRFYLAYRIQQVPAKLRWGHYQLLSTVTDGSERSRFEARAIKNSWTNEQLRAALAENNVGREFVPDGRERGGDGAAEKLRARRGRLYTYRVLESTKEGVTLDLGFNVWRTIPSQRAVPANPGELVESLKSGSEYSFKPTDAVSGMQYTYAAEVTRVVDGDTLWVVADLGFNVQTRCKLRLHGINAPELDTKRGLDAKGFVAEKLADADFVITRTFGTDKYARYLADIYYLPGETDTQKIAEKGSLLNQELLNQRHAVAV